MKTQDKSNIMTFIGLNLTILPNFTSILSDKLLLWMGNHQFTINIYRMLPIYA